MIITSHSYHLWFNIHDSWASNFWTWFDTPLFETYPSSILLRYYNKLLLHAPSFHPYNFLPILQLLLYFLLKGGGRILQNASKVTLSLQMTRPAAFISYPQADRRTRKLKLRRLQAWKKFVFKKCIILLKFYQKL